MSGEKPQLKRQEIKQDEGQKANLEWKEVLFASLMAEAQPPVGSISMPELKTFDRDKLKPKVTPQGTEYNPADPPGLEGDPKNGKVEKTTTGWKSTIKGVLSDGATHYTAAYLYAAGNTEPQQIDVIYNDGTPNPNQGKDIRLKDAADYIGKNTKTISIVRVKNSEQDGYLCTIASCPTKDVAPNANDNLEQASWCFVNADDGSVSPDSLENIQDQSIDPRDCQSKYHSSTTRINGADNKLKEVTFYDYNHNNRILIQDRLDTNGTLTSRSKFNLQNQRTAEVVYTPTVHTIEFEPASQTPKRTIYNKEYNGVTVIDKEIKHNFYNYGEVTTTTDATGQTAVTRQLMNKKGHSVCRDTFDAQYKTIKGEFYNVDNLPVGAPPPAAPYGTVVYKLDSNNQYQIDSMTISDDKGNLRAVLQNENGHLPYERDLSTGKIKAIKGIFYYDDHTTPIPQDKIDKLLSNNPALIHFVEDLNKNPNLP